MVIILFNAVKEASALQQAVMVRITVFYRKCPEDEKHVYELEKLLNNSGLVQNKNVFYVKRDIVQNAAEIYGILQKLQPSVRNIHLSPPIIVITGEETTILLDKNHLELTVPIVNSLLNGEEVRQPDLSNTPIVLELSARC